MKFRTTITLAVVFLLLCAGYVAMEWRKLREVEQELESKKLFGFAPTDVMAVEIQQLGQPNVAAERLGDGWDIKQPDDTIRPFNPIWERVATAFSALMNERVVEESGGDLGRYGLDEPVVTVKASVGEETHTVAFGAQEPTRTFRYAQLDGGMVFLTQENLFFELNRPLKDLRHQFLVDNRNATITRIEFAHIWTGTGETTMSEEERPEPGTESVPLVIARETPEAEWKQVEPVEALADQERANELAQELQFALARDHVQQPENLDNYGLAPARVRITVVQQGIPEPQNLYFGHYVGEDQTGIYARREGDAAVFVVDSHMVSMWPQQLDDFRERRLLTRQVSDISKIEIVSQGQTIVLEQPEDGTWRMAAPVLADVDQRALSNYLARLKGARAFRLDIPTEQGASLQQPALEFRYTVGNTTETHSVVAAGHPTEAGQYVVKQDTGAIGLARAEDIEPLKVSAADFQTKELLRVPPMDAKRIEFVFEGTSYVFEKVHGQWMVRQPEGHVLENQSDVETILGLLNPLMATSGVSEEMVLEMEVYGMDKPVLALYVTTQPEQGEPQRFGPLRIGKPTAENAQERYATIQGKVGAFRVKQDFINRLRDALRGLKAG